MGEDRVQEEEEASEEEEDDEECPPPLLPPLPMEVWVAVFHLLPGPSLLRCEGVCRQWRREVRHLVTRWGQLKHQM